MSQHLSQSDLPRTQRLTERVLATLERFLHIEATSGIVLLVAAAVALIWANSPWVEDYQSLWHSPLSIGMGEWVFSRSLHFWINDGLMALFFLLIGMEIRREVHEGALSHVKQALLPMAAALGGVIVPAVIYLGLNHGTVREQGWAVPTATDIAFAVGILALLGRSIPGNVRVFLLTLAIIDDVVAVLIIAIFYSSGLDGAGFLLAGFGIALVWLLQRMGIGHAYAYVIPGLIVWAGFLLAGVHPTLAGVVLGLMTPVRSRRLREHPLDTFSRVTDELTERSREGEEPSPRLTQPLRQLRLAQREMQPPVVRVQAALHPWVSYGIMPLFALANAGIALGGSGISTDASQWVVLSVILALVAGKPLGVILTSWILVRLGLCRLPAGMTWGGVWLVGLLAGIGFTMSIFIAMLAFTDEHLLEAAKLGVLLGSLMAGSLGMIWGAIYARRQRMA
ncbi:MAG TPA: Na+/H+ antiporter NhaA [Oleiagrimonas sp.]|nr:Na+/H+ antiporter NhaA [Oleiagrimonas sp.]